MSDPDQSTLESMDAAAVEAALPTLSAAGLETLVRRANREYWDHDKPTLPDPLYDRIVERLRKLDPDAAVLSAMGPTPSDGPKLEADEAIRLPPVERFGATVVHKRPMLSLGKCYNEADLLAWAGKITGDFVVMPKMDGIACSLRYDEGGSLVLAATRGSGTEGEDITLNVLPIADVPATIKAEHAPGVEIEVRGELYMRLSSFAQYKGEYAHPRNLTAGSVKQKDPAKSRAQDLSFFPYDVIGPELVDERAKFDFLAAVGFAGLGGVGVAFLALLALGAFGARVLGFAVLAFGFLIVLLVAQLVGHVERDDDIAHDVGIGRLILDAGFKAGDLSGCALLDPFAP